MKKLLVIIFAISMVMSSAYSQEKNPLKIMGVYFGDYFYNVGRDTGYASMKNTVQPGLKDGNGFSIRRVQLAFNYEFSDKILSKLRVESDGAVLNSTNNSFGFFIKDAFIQFNDVLPGMNILTGMISTMSTEVAEGMWGYRALERIPIDLRKYLGTRDLGVAIRGRIDKEGNFGYGFMFGNNSGTTPETDRNKRIYGTFTAKPIKELTLALSGDLAWKDKDQNVTTIQFDGAYSEKDAFTVGIEGGYSTQANLLVNKDTAIKTKDPQSGLVASLYGNFVLMPDLSLVVRYDYFDPNNGTDYLADSRHYILAGLAYSPIKNVKIIPNVQYEAYEKLITKLPSGVESTHEYKPSITAKITFEFKFDK